MTGELARELTATDAVLLEALRDGWRQAQEVFREMFPGPVSLLEPYVRTTHLIECPPESIVVGMRFDGGAPGLAALSLGRTAARVLVVSLLGGNEAHGRRPDDAEVLSLLADTSLELANIVLNAVLAEAGRVLSEIYRFEVPVLMSAKELAAAADARTYLLRGEIVCGDSPPAPTQVIIRRAWSGGGGR